MSSPVGCREAIREGVNQPGLLNAKWQSTDVKVKICDHPEVGMCVLGPGSSSQTNRRQIPMQKGHQGGWWERQQAINIESLL